MHEGVKSGRREPGDALSPGSLMKSTGFPMAAVSNRIFRTCLDGAIQEVVMLPQNGVSFNSRVVKLHYYCTLSQLITLLISYSEVCTGMGGLLLVSKLAQGSSHTEDRHLFSFPSSHIFSAFPVGSLASRKSLLTVNRGTVLPLLEIGREMWVPFACLG